jgi:protein-export membrane protein SecD
MLYFARWKIIAILGSVLLALVFASPNVLPKASQDWLASFTVARPMTLGLDLQGGSNIVMEVDRKELRTTLLKQLSGDVRGALREARIGYRITPSDSAVAVRIIEAADADKAADVLNALRQPIDAGIFGSGAPVSLFDMAREGEQFTFSFSEAGFEAKISRAVDQSMKIIENRINGLGTTEAAIQRQGKDRILIQLPGLQNPDAIIKSFGETGKLTFQLLCEEQQTTAESKPPPDCEALPQKENPDQMLWVQTSSRATVDGADLNDAQPGFDSRDNEPIVSFRFNQKGALRFGKLTTDNVGKRFAIVLDGVIQSAPVINEPILGGSGQISGNFTTEEATSLSVILRSGALPAKLVIIQQTTVGPSLGSDSINAGILASIIGLVAVLAFMLIAYGIFGVFADIALIANLLMLIALMSVFGFTLTLPGIAGIVLTMGMAVDSNVLVYERIREEWRNGRTAINAIETGFKAAFATILDANATTLIAAVVLFGVGSGPVRGFAVTLSIGVITTVFTAFTLTALIVSVWVKRTKPKEVPL